LEFNLGERTIRMARKKTTDKGAAIGFEEKLWLAADKLRGSMDAAEYKHIVLGLVFLKYISDAFEEQRVKVAAVAGADPEDRDEYKADNVFWVPMEARWTATGDVKGIQDKARDPRNRLTSDCSSRTLRQRKPTENRWTANLVVRAFPPSGLRQQGIAG